MEEQGEFGRFQYVGKRYPTLARALRAAYWDYLNSTPVGFDFEGDEEDYETYADLEAAGELEATVHGDALAEVLQGVVFADGLMLTDANLRERAQVDGTLLEHCLEAMTLPPVYEVWGQDYDFIETALLACLIEWNGEEIPSAEELFASPYVEDLKHWLQNILVVDGIQVNDWNVEFLSPHSDTLFEILLSALVTLEEGND